MAAEDQTTRLKAYIRRKFSSGGGGVTYNGTAYAASEAGIKALADAVFASSSQEVSIIQSGFEGGYDTGQIKCNALVLQGIIEEIIEELGYSTVTTGRQMMTFADWSGGTATT
jgi:hypothetical protein